MKYLLDTNMLLRFFDEENERHEMVKGAMASLRLDAHTLCVTSQNLVESWNVVTRPTAKNGFGYTLVEAARMQVTLTDLFELLPDSPLVYPEWLRLVQAYGVSGVQVHDTRLVAFCLVYGVSHILTLNTRDFVRFAPEGITTVDAATVVPTPTNP